MSVLPLFVQSLKLYLGCRLLLVLITMFDFERYFVQVSKVEFEIHRWFSHLPFNYSLIPSSLIHSLSPLKGCIWDSSLVHSFIIRLFIDLFIIDSIILVIHHSNVGFEYHRWFIHPSFNYSNPVHHCVHSFGTHCFTTFQRIPWRRDSNILIIHLSNVEFEYHHWINSSIFHWNHNESPLFNENQLFFNQFFIALISFNFL